MSETFNRRLAAAEEAAKAKVPVFHIIRVRGGLPGPIRCASADGLHWARLPEEAMAVFEKRVITTAQDAKSKSVVIGGLCPCAWKEPGSFERYLQGPDFRRFDEDGIAIDHREDQ